MVCLTLEHPGDATSVPAFAPPARTALSTVVAGCIWPALAALMYTTFTQVPLAAHPAATRDPRFIAAALLGNFVVLPLVVWGMLAVLPGDPAMLLGLALVLLVPCTDWFFAFTSQGGDARRDITLAPVLACADGAAASAPVADAWSQKGGHAAIEPHCRRVELPSSPLRCCLPCYGGCRAG